LNAWLGIQPLDPNLWPTTSLHAWWGKMTKRKDVASLTFLVSWELWNERNARVFKGKQAPPSVLFNKIKQEAKLWILVGDKCMSNLMPRE
jgi:hypothetical protein